VTTELSKPPTLLGNACINANVENQRIKNNKETQKGEVDTIYLPFFSKNLKPHKNQLKSPFFKTHTLDKKHQPIKMIGKFSLDEHYEKNGTTRNSVTTS
jgi:hypothetical protein